MVEALMGIGIGIIVCVVIVMATNAFFDWQERR